MAINDDNTYTVTPEDLNSAGPEDVTLTPEGIHISTLPPQGTLTLNGSPVEVDQDISLSDIEAGNLVFTPSSSSSGMEDLSMSYQLNGANTPPEAFNLGFGPVIPEAGTESAQQEWAPDEQLFASSELDGWSINGEHTNIAGAAVLEAGTSASITVDTSQDSANYTLSLNGHGDYTVEWDGEPVATTSIPGEDSEVRNFILPQTEQNQAELTVVANQETALESTVLQASSAGFDVQEGHPLVEDFVEGLVAENMPQDLSFMVSGFPAGTILDDGMNTLTSTGEPMDLTGWNLPAIELTPPSGDPGAFDLLVTASGTNPESGDREARSLSLHFNSLSENESPVVTDEGLLMHEGDSHTFVPEDFAVHGMEMNSASPITINSLPESGTLILEDMPVEAGQQVAHEDIEQLAYIAPSTDQDQASQFSFTPGEGPSAGYEQPFNLDIVGAESGNSLAGATNPEMIFTYQPAGQFAGPDNGSGEYLLSSEEDMGHLIWHLNEHHGVENQAADMIQGFQVGQGGDVLDLSDVLDGQGEHLEDYLHFNFDQQGDTILEVSPEAGGEVTQEITFQGVDMSALGGSDAEIINQLMNDGNLQMDP